MKVYFARGVDLVSTVVHSEGLLSCRGRTTSSFLCVVKLIKNHVVRTTTGARMAVSTGRPVDEAFAMAVDVEPASKQYAGVEAELASVRR